MFKYMELATNEAKIILENNKEGKMKKCDIPVGAVIIKGGKVISKGKNEKYKNCVSFHHAEIVAIEKACAKLKSSRLDGCVIYVTLEPCLMCYGAIVESRIKEIVYAVDSPKYGFSNFIDDPKVKVRKLGGCSEKENKLMLKTFFEEKR